MIAGVYTVAIGERQQRIESLQPRIAESRQIAEFIPRRLQAAHKLRDDKEAALTPVMPQDKQAAHTGWVGNGRVRDLHGVRLHQATALSYAAPVHHGCRWIGLATLCRVAQRRSLKGGSDPDPLEHSAG